MNKRTIIAHVVARVYESQEGTPEEKVWLARALDSPRCRNPQGVPLWKTLADIWGIDSIGVEV